MQGVILHLENSPLPSRHIIIVCVYTLRRFPGVFWNGWKVTWGEEASDHRFLSVLSPFLLEGRKYWSECVHQGKWCSSFRLPLFSDSYSLFLRIKVTGSRKMEIEPPRFDRHFLVSLFSHSWANIDRLFEQQKFSELIAVSSCQWSAVSLSLSHSDSFSWIYPPSRHERHSSHGKNEGKKHQMFCST